MSSFSVTATKAELLERHRKAMKEVMKAMSPLDNYGYSHEINYSSCPKCHGKGRLKCGTCHGEKQLTCPKCKLGG